MTPYYADGIVTLYHGDCLDVMRSIDDESVDIVVTSPPYNMGLTPGGNGRGLYRHSTQKATRFGDGYSEVGDDSMDPDEYESWLLDVLDGMLRCARRAVFLNHRPRIIHGQATPPIDFASLKRHLSAAGAQLRQIITWDRGTGIDVNLNHFCTRGEWIMVLAKPTFRLVNHAASGMGDVWRMPIVTGSDHPAPFPVELPARCIAATGADSVLDPFAGSGTTLVAAKRVGVRSVGIEKSERYCEMAAKRLASTPVSMFAEAEPAKQMNLLPAGLPQEPTEGGQR